MVQSKAQTVEGYLNELTDERREIISTIRNRILDILPDGYVESMNWGMISYEIPLETYPDTYNGQPLGIASIASQKNHLVIYMMGCYIFPEQTNGYQTQYGQIMHSIHNTGKDTFGYYHGVDPTFFSHRLY